MEQKIEKVVKADFDKVVTDAEKLAARVEAVVSTWFADHFHNTVVSRDTAVVNLIHSAKPALIRALVDSVQTKE